MVTYPLLSGTAVFDDDADFFDAAVETDFTDAAVDADFFDASVDAGFDDATDEADFDDATDDADFDDAPVGTALLFALHPAAVNTRMNTRMRPAYFFSI
jgi:hypothetical protein